MRALVSLLGIVLAAAIILAGPAVWWLDRRPLGSPPLIHFKVMLWSVNWPGESLAAQVADIKVQDARLAAAAVTRNAQIAAASAEANASIVATLTASLVQAKANTRTLTQEIPVYVTAKADAACIVPNGFVELHDAAAGGSPLAGVPSAAGGPVDAPSGIALSRVADTVTVNYGSWWALYDEVKAWRAWYPAQAAIWAQPPR